MIMIVHVSISLIFSCIVVYIYICIVVLECFSLVSIISLLYLPTWAHHQEYFSGTLQNSLYNILKMSAPSTSFQIRDHLANYFLFYRGLFYTGIEMFYKVVWRLIQLSINLPTCLIKNTKMLNLFDQ